MSALFAKHENGVAVKLNCRGDFIPISAYHPLTIEEVMGARVRLSRKDNAIHCEIHTHESTSPYRCILPLNDENFWGNFAERQLHSLFYGVDSLEQLVSKVRIALNGRW